MTRHFIKHILLGVVVSLGSFASSYGQDVEQKISKDTLGVMSKAFKNVNAGKHQKALGKYEKLLKSAELNAYETSVIYQLKGLSEYHLGSYELAIMSFQNAIAVGGLTETEAAYLEKDSRLIGKLIQRKDTIDAKDDNTEIVGSFAINPAPRTPDAK